MAEEPRENPGMPEGEVGSAMLDRMNGGTHEQLANWAFQYVQFSDDMEYALDIGCGGGANVARLLDRIPFGEVVGIDPSPLSVQKSIEYNAKAVEEGRATIQQAEAADMSALPNSAFDVVTAFETIYFWKDVPAALEEIKRVMLPGGTLLICNEADGSDSDHYFMAMRTPGMTIYTPRELDSLLRDAGFKRIQIYDDVKSGHVCVTAKKPKMPEKL